MDIRLIQNQSGSRNIFGYTKVIIAIIFIILLSGGIFIKTDTSLAAEITDSYLRPIFGDKQVIFLEKVYFNFSDSISQLAYKFKKPVAPQITVKYQAPEQIQIDTALSAMNLDPIPANPAFTPIDGEGIWRNLPLNIFPDKIVMAETFVRPDSSRDYALTTIVKIDTRFLMLGSVAGTKEPGGKVGKPGSGKVPEEIVKSGKLVAAFDGGFQYRDGAFGMRVDDTTYLPLKIGLGTIVGYRDGSIKIFNYKGEDLGSDINFARQNGPMMIENGNIMVTDPDSRQTWGRVVGADSFTWRSGVGISKNGELLFAVGNNLNPTTLANALQMAGAVNAIQLDINPYWVRFNIFNATSQPDKYDSYPLTKDLQDGAKDYLGGYQKDFFYIYKK
jgi:hypothetical protein